MSDKDTTVLTLPAATPGMRIVYQRPINPEGCGISFEIAEDVALQRGHLDEVLTKIDGAARRLAAIEELPRLAQLTKQYREELKVNERGLEVAVARMEAIKEQRNQGRRNEQPASFNDVQQVQQYNNKIAELRTKIGLNEKRIPYLQALADGGDAAEPIADWQGRPEAAD